MDNDDETPSLILQLLGGAQGLLTGIALAMILSAIPAIHQDQMILGAYIIGALLIILASFPVGFVWVRYNSSPKKDSHKVISQRMTSVVLLLSYIPLIVLIFIFDLYEDLFLQAGFELLSYPIVFIFAPLIAVSLAYGIPYGLGWSIN